MSIRIKPTTNHSERDMQVLKPNQKKSKLIQKQEHETHINKKPRKNHPKLIGTYFIKRNIMNENLHSNFLT